MESSVRLFSVASGVLAVCVCFNWLTCLLIPSPGIFNRLVGYPVIPQVVPEAFMTTVCSLIYYLVEELSLD